MAKRNHVWIVEYLRNQKYWMPSDMVELTLREARREMKDCQEEWPKAGFRITRYESAR